MQDFVDGQVVETAEELFREALNLRHGKLNVFVEQASEVVVHKFKDKVDVALEPIVLRGCGEFER